MSSATKSRWAEDDEETRAHIEQRKREKEAKKRAKEERVRKQEEEQKRLLANQEAESANGQAQEQDGRANGDGDRPVKRRRLSVDRTEEEGKAEQKPPSLLRFSAPGWGPCRHVDSFERLNAIEEGSYGWVSRAKETTTGEIIAIKKLKMENAQDGFPITGLREVQTLFHARHPHIVRLREVIMGDKMDE